MQDITKILLRKNNGVSLPNFLKDSVIPPQDLVNKTCSLSQICNMESLENGGVNISIKTRDTYSEMQLSESDYLSIAKAYGVNIDNHKFFKGKQVISVYNQNQNLVGLIPFGKVNYKK